MKILLLLTCALFPLSASAYIGPSLSGGTLAVVLGVFVSIVLAVIAIVYYPIKRMIKKISGKSDIESEQRKDE